MEAKKQKSKKIYHYTEKEQSELTTRIYQYGKEEGKKELRRELAELLGLYEIFDTN